MSKKYSNPLDRAMNILQYAMDKEMSVDFEGGVDSWLSVGELGRLLNVTKPTVYKSLNMLMNGGLISRQVIGRNSFYKITSKGVKYYEQNYRYVDKRAFADATIAAKNGVS